MLKFQGFEGAKYHLQLTSNFCHKIFQRGSTVQYLPDYKIVKQKFFTSILKIGLFR